MNAQEALRSGLNLSHRVLTTYIGDLSDGELLVRALPDTNHIAWQLGHLLSAENGMIEFIKPGSSPTLSAEFKAKHTKDKTKGDNPSDFESKETYLNLFSQQREATIQVLESLSEIELEKPGIENMRQLAPTVGATFALIAGHGLMHAGQFVAIRRKLGKPVLI